MKDSNRDRGNKKWSMAMMLPEHIVELRKWRDEDHYTERPQFDDFDLQSIQENIEISYKRKCSTHVQREILVMLITGAGKIEDINAQTWVLIFDTTFGGERLSFADIVGVQAKNDYNRRNSHQLG